MSEYDDDKGWLSSKGCNLTAGRPPVCHEFVCNKIRDSVPKDHYSGCLWTVSKLLAWAGENALGDRHLVTLSTSEIKFLNFDRLRKRIARCAETCDQCEKLLS